MASWEEIQRRVRQDKDRVRKFVATWHARPFKARTEAGDPITVERSRSEPDNWRVTYYAEGQPAGYSEERSFRAAVRSALVEHRACLEEAEPFVDLAVGAENALAYAESIQRRARADDMDRTGDLEAFVSPLWPEVFDAYEVAADAFEDVGQSFRANALRRHLDWLASHMSVKRAPRRTDRDRQWRFG